LEYWMSSGVVRTVLVEYSSKNFRLRGAISVEILDR
jgi:hypothetical protein